MTMDELDILDDDHKKQLISKFDIEKAAEKHCLPENLTIQLIKACIKKKLDYDDKHLGVNNHIKSGFLKFPSRESFENKMHSFERPNSNEKTREIIYAECRVDRNDFKHYLESREKRPIKGLIANSWPEEEQVTSEDTTRKRSDKLKKKDEDFKSWIKENPGFNSKDKKMKKKEIREALEKRNGELWFGGFDYWWKSQDICKMDPGRPPKGKK
jgi:hypothetical protein